MGRTIAQKILEAHAVEGGPVEPGAIVQARLDRVLLNDISGPMAFAQFERMGGRRVADPEKVVLVCDHFVPPSTLAAARALREMRAFARSQGISAFYDVGQGGIEHTLLPERGLVSPGALIIGGDSHTCTYSAFNAFGTGLGSTDIAAALPWAPCGSWSPTPPASKCTGVPDPVSPARTSSSTCWAESAPTEPPTSPWNSTARDSPT